MTSLRSLPDHEPIDQALVLWFAQPRSATGEDVLEIHHHGSLAVRDLLLNSIALVPGCRPAEAGEFSKRAFMNGKLDLVELEGLADLIDATTRDQAQQAVRQLDGELSQRFERWRTQIVELLAFTEAIIDFGDEEGDVADTSTTAWRDKVEVLHDDMLQFLNDGRRGERLRDGLKLVVMGPPNAGKSSLINKLAKRDVAIVDAEAGTTRDAIAVDLEIAGVPVTLMDTAGLRQSANRVEAEGIRRTWQHAGQADIILALVDGSSGLQGAIKHALHDDQVIISVVNKIDLMGPTQIAPNLGIPISCKSGAGLDTLWDEIERTVTDIAGLRSDQPLALTNIRQRQLLEQAAAALEPLLQGGGRGENTVKVQADSALMSEQLRLCARALGQISGRVTVDDVLDVIFQRFCIGK